METEGRPGRPLSDDELDRLIARTDEELLSQIGERLDAIRVDPADIVRRTLEVLGAAVPLPDATADDFGRVDSPEQLRTPEAWAEWLGLPTGRMAWLEDPGGFSQVPETNYMARAAVGDTASGYVKTREVLEGLDVWRKREGR